jgi:hypothetical protein
MGITHRWFEDTVNDKAEELAEKQTGRNFLDLPRAVQSDIWNQAWQLSLEAQNEAVEQQMELAKERRAGI